MLLNFGKPRNLLRDLSYGLVKLSRMHGFFGFDMVFGVCSQVSMDRFIEHATLINYISTRPIIALDLPINCLPNLVHGWRIACMWQLA